MTWHFNIKTSICTYFGYALQVLNNISLYINPNLPLESRWLCTLCQQIPPLQTFESITKLGWMLIFTITSTKSATAIIAKENATDKLRITSIEKKPSILRAVNKHPTKSNSFKLNMFAAQRNTQLQMRASESLIFMFLSEREGLYILSIREHQRASSLQLIFSSGIEVVLRRYLFVYMWCFFVYKKGVQKCTPLFYH